MERKGLLFSEQRRKKKNGFTLVEIIVVITIVSILAMVVIPAMTRYFDLSKEKSDIGQLGLLNRVTQVYRLENREQDPFSERDAESATLMNKLVSENFLSSPVIPLVSGASYQWSLPENQWIYLKEDGVYLSLLLKDVNLLDYIKEGSWTQSTTGVKSSYGLLFVSNPKNHYTFTSKATLGPGSFSSGTSGGYGILFETTLNENNKDTGYVLQIDRGYAAGEITIRPREAGVEKSPILRLGNFTNPTGVQRYSPIIPASKTDPWWTEEHEVTIEVASSSVPGKKNLTVYIDGEMVIESFSINSAPSDGEKFSGVRSFQAETTYQEFTIR